MIKNIITGIIVLVVGGLILHYATSNNEGKDDSLPTAVLVPTPESSEVSNTSSNDKLPEEDLANNEEIASSGAIPKPTEEELRAQIELINRLKFRSSRDEEFKDMVDQAISLNYLDFAFELIAKLQFTSARDLLYKKLAVESARQGREDLREKSLQRIHYSSTRDEAIKEILELNRNK